MRGVGHEAAQLILGARWRSAKASSIRPSIPFRASAEAGRPRCARSACSTRRERSPAAIASAVWAMSLERAQLAAHEPPGAAAEQQQHGRADGQLDAQELGQRAVHVVEREREHDRAAVGRRAMARIR